MSAHPLPCRVVTNLGETVTHITTRDMTPLISLTPDQAEAVAGHLLNHASNLRAALAQVAARRRSTDTEEQQ